MKKPIDRNAPRARPGHGQYRCPLCDTMKARGGVGRELTFGRYKIVYAVCVPCSNKNPGRIKMS